MRDKWGEGRSLLKLFPLNSTKMEQVKEKCCVVMYECHWPRHTM